MTKKELAEAPVENTEPKGSLYERINWVRSNLPEIGKDKTIGKGDYAYSVATHENINKHLRPLMAKAGLIDYCSLESTETVDTGMEQGASGRKVMHVRSIYVYTVLSILDSLKLEIRTEGWGEDAGDKGPGKAQTYAMKAGRCKVFSIAAGDNEEGRDEQVMAAPKPYLTPEHVSEILELADDLYGSDADSKLKSMCERVFHVPQLKMIADEHHPQVINLLNRQAKRDGKKSDDVEA